MSEWTGSPNPGYLIHAVNGCYAQVPFEYRKRHIERECNVRRETQRASNGTNLCADCGATVRQSEWEKHRKWHKEIREGMDMSRVAWCDYGDHPFKRGVEGSASFSGTVNTPDGPEVQEMDACPQHNPMRADPKNVAKELEAAYPVTDDGENLSGH